MRRLSAIPYRVWLLGVFLAVLGVSFIAPVDASDQWLEHSPTVALLIFLLILERRGPLSNAAYTLLFIFMLLHVLGAHYLYSGVPYDEWCRMLFGTGLNDMMGRSRNHYDRFVHFMFGILLVVPMRELVKRFMNISDGASLVVAVAFLAVLSKVYEIAEWGVAAIMSPEAAERYNGQQGDPFDAQKDMALALCGSIISAIVIAVCRRMRRKAR